MEVLKDQVDDLTKQLEELKTQQAPPLTPEQQAVLEEAQIQALEAGRKEEKRIKEQEQERKHKEQERDALADEDRQQRKRYTRARLLAKPTSVCNGFQGVRKWVRAIDAISKKDDALTITVAETTASERLATHLSTAQRQHGDRWFRVREDIIKHLLGTMQGAANAELVCLRQKPHEATLEFLETFREIAEDAFGDLNDLCSRS